MCLGEIGQVVELRAGGRALVRTPQRTVAVSLVTLEDPVSVGDWVVTHSGFALARLGPAEAEEALALRAAPASPDPDPSRQRFFELGTPWEGSA